MSQKRIYELDRVTSINDGDVIPIDVDNGDTTFTTKGIISSNTNLNTVSNLNTYPRYGATTYTLQNNYSMVIPIMQNNTATTNSDCSAIISSLNTKNPTLTLNLINTITGGIAGGLAGGIAGGSVSSINCMVLDGTTLYIGGSFATVGGVPRLNIAAINVTDGSLLSWYPTGGVGESNARKITSMVLDGTTLYVAGTFLFAAGSTRNYIAALSTIDGSLLPWYPTGGADATVSTMALDGTTLYVGGAFGTVGGSTRARIAALSTTDGSVLSWYPTGGVGGTAIVYAIAKDSTAIYIGGDFGLVSSVSRVNIAALSTTDGSLLPWYPTGGANGSIYAMLLDGTTLYIGGSFASLVGGSTRARIAALSTTDGSVLSWYPTGGSGNIPYSLLLYSGNLYLGGTFSQLSSAGRLGFAVVSASTAAVTNIYPTQDRTGNALYQVSAKVNDATGFSTPFGTAVQVEVSTNYWYDIVYQAVITNIIPNGTITKGCMILFRIERLATDALDTSAIATNIINIEVTQ